MLFTILAVAICFFHQAKGCNFLFASPSTDSLPKCFWFRMPCEFFLTEGFLVCSQLLRALKHPSSWEERMGVLEGSGSSKMLTGIFGALRVW